MYSLFYNCSILNSTSTAVSIENESYGPAFVGGIIDGLVDIDSCKLAKFDRVREGNGFSLSDAGTYGYWDSIVDTGVGNPMVQSPILGRGSAATAVKIASGGEHPENFLAAPVGSLYLRSKYGGAGTTLFVKESGTGDTGWSSF